MRTWLLGATVTALMARDPQTERLTLDTPADCENIFKYPKQYVPWLGEDVPKEMARQLVDGWMDSPGHRANILRVASHQLGVGVYVNGRVYATVYATQNFASCP